MYVYDKILCTTKFVSVLCSGPSILAGHSNLLHCCNAYYVTENAKGDIDVPQLQVSQKRKLIIIYMWITSLDVLSYFIGDVPQSSRGAEPSTKRVRADSPGSDVQGALSGIVTSSTSILKGIPVIITCVRVSPLPC